ncbi:MAG TPA: methyl-accepting chemotaxis protein [Burkholderiaceae bacterium]|jgi:methyl-accepting chemotaxis protein-1 (serine sensor receptor)
MQFDKLTVRGKLTFAFGGLSALVVLVAGLSVESLGEANERFVTYVQGIDARTLMAGNIRTAIDRRAIAARNLVLVTKPADLALEKAAVTQAHEDVQGYMSQLNQMVNDSKNATAKAHDMVAAISKIETTYGPVALDIVNLALNGKTEAAVTKMNNECRPLLAALVKASDDYEAYNQGRAHELIEQAAAEYALQRNLLIAGCLMTLAAAVLAGTLITRSLTRALGAEPGTLGTIAQRVAEGDLSPVSGAASVPAGSVMASLVAMQTSLSTIVGQVRNSSDSIAGGSEKIATGNADLSRRTEQQASNLQETAASMEELSSTVKNNAESAGHATELASSASAAAVKGGEMVGLVVSTMQDIAAASNKIAEITGVVDGIAFQTNILALNAAVEAARAGEQGRGFAVVASEVRSLAGRSAEAAKQIKTLIGASVAKVQVGARQVNDAGASMEEIVAQVKRVSNLISEISYATSEQSSGISQVGTAVTELDKVTQQNATLVEESSSAAASLKHQAAALAQLVSVFKLAPGTGHGAVTVSEPKATPPVQAERRGPNRTDSVVRPSFKAKPKPKPKDSAEAKPIAKQVQAAPPVQPAPKTGTDDWETF